jgi:hypothetical protein
MAMSYLKSTRRILTKGQMREGKPCDICQEEAIKHAETFKERFEELGEEGKDVQVAD